ncbi:hypothetical protein ABH930_006409 [Kitasatospora sp. GAS204A]|uniref:DUF6907 domain-containing protein n=1 Tax=unclassified Kitasatospora TaxID=2633591 RepID=UPI0024756594|nr:hypothetical protein [Kitasatospora sp. GAS204B]MDH6121999.1 hypothetical protein [Kitasatospora sp. GAS204B]
MNRVANVHLANGGTIELPEPAWCTSQHEQGLDRTDLFHEGPEMALVVDTVRGRVRVLEAALTQYPFASTDAGRVPVVTVALDGGYASFDPLGLRALSLGLARHAERLQQLAYELERLRAEGSR